MPRLFPLPARARLPAAILVLAGFLTTLEMLGVLPPRDIVFKHLQGNLERGGAPAILICSALEHVVGLSTYFPGSVIILLGMSLTAGRPLLAIKVWCAIVAGAVIGLVVSYRVGRTWPSGSTMPGSLEYCGAFVHPQLGAIVVARAGSCGVEPWRLVRRAALPFLGWYGVWGVAMFSSGDAVLSGLRDGGGGLLVVVCGWFLYEVWSARRATPPGGATSGAP